jgi:hypothetical protein
MSGVPDESLEGADEANTPTPDAIEAQLARISISESFLAAERLRDFLNFVVVQYLKGNSDQLKEFTILSN